MSAHGSDAILAPGASRQGATPTGRSEPDRNAGSATALLTTTAMLDLARLELLREVALAGSLARAADELCMTASAVSRELAELEREAGTRLVRHASSGVALTRAGRALAAHACAIHAESARALAELGPLAGRDAGTLRVGALPEAATALVPQAAVALHVRHPEIVVEVVERGTERSLAELQDGRLDLAVVDAEGHVPARRDRRIERIRLLEDPIELLVASDHRLADAERVSLDQLRSERIADCCAASSASVLASLGTDPNVVVTCHSLAVLHAVVAAGTAIGFASSLAQREFGAGVAVKPIGPPTPVRCVDIAVRCAHCQPAFVAAMIDGLRDVAAGFTADRDSRGFWSADGRIR